MVTVQPSPGRGEQKILLLFLKIFSRSPLRGSERLCPHGAQEGAKAIPIPRDD